jgi:hypothetical protein
MSLVAPLSAILRHAHPKATFLAKIFIAHLNALSSAIYANLVAIRI